MDRRRSAQPWASPERGSVVIRTYGSWDSEADDGPVRGTRRRACLLAAPAMAAEDGEPTLLGRAILASDAFQPGP
jgi:hypothetical protein